MNGGFNFKDVLFFNKFLTPMVITFVYWLALIGIVAASVVMMFNNFMTGLMVLIFGTISVRIYIEILMVIFRMNSNLEKIAQNTSKEEE
jgi:hypothetical protein